MKANSTHIISNSISLRINQTYRDDGNKEQKN